MPDYKNYTAEDFLADESFVNSLLHQNEADVQLWKERRDAGLLNEAAWQQAIMLLTVMKENSLSFINRDHEYDKLQALIAANKPTIQSTGVIKPMTARAGIYRLFKWQAAAAILVIGVAAWFLFKPSSGSSESRQNFHAVATTGNNHIKKVTLPDGSEVILNGNSSVSIGPDFNKDKREVLLQGTAFFEVAKNPAKPFTVISGAVSTTALGTSFYIHQSSNAAPTTVSLLTGKVRIDAAGVSSVNLIPYEKAVYAKGEEQMAKATYNRDELVNWTNGTIVLKNAGWEEVQHIFEEYFDRKLVVETAIKHTQQKEISFTGEFKADQPEALLSSLEFTYDLKYTIQNKTVNIAF